VGGCKDGGGGGGELVLFLVDGGRLGGRVWTAVERSGRIGVEAGEFLR